MRKFLYLCTMNIPTSNIEQLRQLLDAAEKIAILSHTNPDGDALGSSLALAEVLREKGHTVHCIVPNRYPYYLKWIPELSQTLIHSLDEEHRCESVIAEADLIICADMSSLSRLEGLSEVISANTSAKRVLIDHHLSPEEGFDVMFSFPEASSTAFVVYNILDALYGKEVFTKGVKHTIKFKAHDENNEAHIGDVVQIMLTRPLSKDKCWRVIEILERAK